MYNDLFSFDAICILITLDSEGFFFSLLLEHLLAEATT